MISIGLYVMGEKGLNCVREAVSLNRDGICRIAFVVAARDTTVQRDYFDEIALAAHDLPFFERRDFDSALADISFAISWRWLIHDGANLFVFHDSLLPKYRGFNPLVTALIEGDSLVGVTAIRANAEFDRGNIVGAASMTVEYPAKIAQIITRISVLYQKLLRDVILAAASNSLTETVQDEAQASYSLWRDADDYRIDWSLDEKKIVRMIDAVGFPYNGAFTEIEGVKIVVLEAEALPEMPIANRVAGKLIGIGPKGAQVVCGKGIVRIKKAVLESGEPYTFAKLRCRLK